jgi:hypothetical protein
MPENFNPTYLIIASIAGVPSYRAISLRYGRSENSM